MKQTCPFCDRLTDVRPAFPGSDAYFGIHTSDGSDPVVDHRLRPLEVMCEGSFMSLGFAELRAAELKAVSL